MIDLNHAWQSLNEGDLPSLAAALGGIYRKDDNGIEKNKGLFTRGGGVDQHFFFCLSIVLCMILGVKSLPILCPFRLIIQ